MGTNTLPVYFGRYNAHEWYTKMVDGWVVTPTQTSAAMCLLMIQIKVLILVMAVLSQAIRAGGGFLTFRDDSITAVLTLWLHQVQMYRDGKQRSLAFPSTKAAGKISLLNV